MSIESEGLAYVMPNPVRYNMLLGCAWMHQVKARSDYGNITYTILDSNGKWKQIPIVVIPGKLATATGPSVLMAAAQIQQHLQQE
jgi:hypothetical protein